MACENQKVPLNLLLEMIVMIFACSGTYLDDTLINPGWVGSIKQDFWWLIEQLQG